MALSILSPSISHHRKEKDPLKPKHPMSAFFLFTNERRAALLADNKSILEVFIITMPICKVL